MALSRAAFHIIDTRVVGVGWGHLFFSLLLRQPHHGDLGVREASSGDGQVVHLVRSAADVLHGTASKSNSVRGMGTTLRKR